MQPAFKVNTEGENLDSLSPSLTQTTGVHFSSVQLGVLCVYSYVGILLLGRDQVNFHFVLLLVSVWEWSLL